MESTKENYGEKTDHFIISHTDFVRSEVYEQQQQAL